MKTIEEYSDEELFALLNQSNEQSENAFSELYRRHSPRVFAYCKRYLGNQEEAKDVFQETFIRFYKSADKNRVMTNVPAFLLRIARNICVNFLKQKKNTQGHVSYEDYMASQEEKKYSGDDELLNLINTALDTLPEKYKEMFILREYEGLSYSDIAEVTDENVSNVKIRIHRAKQKIREILEPYIKELDKF